MDTQSFGMILVQARISEIECPSAKAVEEHSHSLTMIHTRDRAKKNSRAVIGGVGTCKAWPGGRCPSLAWDTCRVSGGGNAEGAIGQRGELLTATGGASSRVFSSFSKYCTVQYKYIHQPCADRHQLSEMEKRSRFHNCFKLPERTAKLGPTLLVTLRFVGTVQTLFPTQSLPANQPCTRRHAAPNASEGGGRRKARDNERARKRTQRLATALGPRRFVRSAASTPACSAPRPPNSTSLLLFCMPRVHGTHTRLPDMEQLPLINGTPCAIVANSSLCANYGLHFGHSFSTVRGASSLRSRRNVQR